MIPAYDVIHPSCVLLPGTQALCSPLYNIHHSTVCKYNRLTHQPMVRPLSRQRSIDQAHRDVIDFTGDSLRSVWFSGRGWGQHTYGRVDMCRGPIPVMRTKNEKIS